MDNEIKLLSYNEAHEYLDEVAESLPAWLYDDLNGGIVLLPEEAPSPQSVANDLYTLGLYHYDPLGMGRYITLYYGSFARIYRGRTVQAQKDALREVLLHELCHHLEHLGGVRDLEVEDEVFMANYLRQHGKGEPE